MIVTECIHYDQVGRGGGWGIVALSSTEASLCHWEAGETGKERALGMMGRGKRRGEAPASSLFPWYPSHLFFYSSFWNSGGSLCR